MKAVYEATYAIEELGVEVGDVVLVEPGHRETPLVIVRGFDRNRLPQILDHLDHFTLSSFDGPSSGLRFPSQSVDGAPPAIGEVVRF